MAQVCEVSRTPGNGRLGRAISPAGSPARNVDQAIRAADILELVRVPHSENVDDCVRQFTRIAARLAKADGCTILLLIDARREAPVFRRYGCCDEALSMPESWVRGEERAAREAVTSGETVVVTDTGARVDPVRGNGTRHEGYCLVSAPIRSGGTTVGAVSAIGTAPDGGFCPDAIAAVEITAWTLGHALQAARLQKLLRSQFAVAAVAAETRAGAGDAYAMPSERSGQLVRILAKSFYREMVKVGLEPNQIVGAASEIISQLSANLRMHKQRLQRTNSASERQEAELR